MKNRNFYIKLIVLFLTIASLTTFSENLCYSKTKTRLEVLLPYGPTVIPFSVMMPVYTKNDIEFNFNAWKNIDELVVKAAEKKFDVLIGPLVTIVNLYNRGIDLKYLATFNWASFYLVSKEPVRRIEALKGNTIYIAQKGSTQDVIFNIYLSKKGLNDRITVYYASPQEISTLFIAGKIQHALLPEPFVTLCESKGGFISLDVQRLYRELVGSYQLPITSVAVRGDLDKDIILGIDRIFRGNFNLFGKSSTPFVERGSIFLNLDRAILSKSLKRLSFRYLSGSSRRDVERFLRFILEKEPRLINGKIPGEEFYQF